MSSGCSEIISQLYSTSTANENAQSLPAVTLDQSTCFMGSGTGVLMIKAENSIESIAYRINSMPEQMDAKEDYTCAFSDIVPPFVSNKYVVQIGAVSGIFGQFMNLVFAI